MPSSKPWMQSGSGGRALVVNAPAAEALRDRVVAVFGSKAAEAMQPLQAAGPDGLQITGCDFRVYRPHTS